VTGLPWAALQIANAFGHDIPDTPDQINALAGGVVAFVGLVAPVLHIASNPAAGLPTDSNLNHELSTFDHYPDFRHQRH
jgi:hypothetical protein